MRVCVIGAGVSGLTAVKQCLDEGLEAVCYESNSESGGVWCYSAQYRAGEAAGVYDGLLMNTSKHMSCFSDYPPPTNGSMFLKREEFKTYLQDYAQYFNLQKHIHYNTKVLKVQAVDDEAQWKVLLKEKEDTKTEVFDAILVCTGRFRHPVLAKFPGTQNFRGKIQHSIEFKTKEHALYKNKNVLVIGNSYTAGDLASLVADVSKKTFMSVGNGSYIVTRYLTAANKAPIDATIFQRGIMYNPDMGKILTDAIVQESDHIIDHQAFNIKSIKPAVFSPMIINESLGGKVKAGAVKVKRFVKEFTVDGVQFDDGSMESIDTVIMATGYDIDFPFLEKGIVAETAKNLELYELVWPLTTKKANLAFIGCYSPRQSVIPGVELQSRWAARVFAGKCSLPSLEDMRNEITERKKCQMATFGKVDCFPVDSGPHYQDRIAEKIDARPTPWAIIDDPKLAYCIAYGPAFTYHYRLQGPHAWPKAREHSLQAYKEWSKQTESSSFVDQLKNQYYH